MSIKIGGANLIKRYINGQSIKKVMYNGQQIWGEGIVPPPVDYHIIGDFQGGMPSGWTSTGGTVSGGGLRNGGARWNQMPDLTNAIRIKIVYNIDVDGDSELSGEIKRGDNTYYGTTMGNDGGLTQNLHSLFFPYENTSETFTSFPAGTYIITADMDLIALTAIQELECPPLGHVENSEISITQEDVNLIRTGKVFDIFANASTVVHKIDFYVWYGHSEQQWLPEGYSMPTGEAYYELINKLTSMGIAGNQVYKILHMPLVGYGHYTNTDRSGVGSVTYMWTSSPYCSRATSMWISDGGVDMTWYDGRSYGQPVRALKDEYIAPDSTWTVEYGNLGGAGVFRSQRLGLISITDGNDYNLTMSDKNLGATIAWSYGDTLTDANCGLYYQWGNCYGFSFAGGFTTDTQCVDTAGYGYGNYYSRGVYVLSDRWSCNQNDGLWDPNPYVPVTGFSLQEEGQTITLHPGDTYQLHASVTPSNASNKGIDYYSSDGIRFSGAGLITISPQASSGTYTVYATCCDLSTTKTCTIVVDNPSPVVPVNDLAVRTSEIIAPGSTGNDVSVRVGPKNATDTTTTVTTNVSGVNIWYYNTSSYTDYYVHNYKMSVSNDVPLGTIVTITAASNDGARVAQTQFTVSDILVSSIFITTGASSLGYISQGETVASSLTVRPGNATNKNISFTADNPGVTLTFINSGWNPREFYNFYSLSVDRNVPVDTVVTLTAASADGNVTETRTFTVSEFVPVTGIGILEAGKTLRITKSNGYINYGYVYPRICPYNASIQSMTASSDNPNITVTHYDGSYYILSGGDIGDTAHIEFTSDDGNYTTGFDVEIIAGTPVTGLSFTEDYQSITLHPGETYQLNAHVEPVGATNQIIDYYPFIEQCGSVPDFFTVSSTGLITMSQNAHDGARGSVILRANDGPFEGRCDIHCTEYYMAYWTDKDGNIIETDYVSSGETPVFNGTTPSCYDPEEITTEECVFDHWSPTPGPIYANTTYHPVFRNINGPSPDDDF